MALRNLNVKIDGQAMDLEKGASFPLSLVYSIDEVEKISSLTGSRSKKSYNFPTTYNNAQTFDDFHDPSVVNPEAGKVKNARIEVNTLPVFSGKAQLAKAKTTKGRHHRRSAGYTASFFGDNADWFLQLKEKCLAEFDYGTHIYDQPTIEGGTNADPLNGDEWCYTLIKWKAWENDTYVTWFEHTLAYFIYPLIIKGFQEIGYRIESTFLEEEFFRRLILPISFRKYSDEYFESNSTSVRFEGNLMLSSSPRKINFQNIIKGVPSHFNLMTDVFTTPFSGALDVQIIAREFVGDGAVFTVYQNGSAVGFFGLLESTFVLTVTAGDAIEVYATAVVNGGTLLSTTIRFAPSDRPIGENDLVIPNLLIPSEWKLTDLLVDLTNLFGLRWETDTEASVVYVEPADRYKLKWRNTAGNQQAAHEGFFRDSTTINVNDKVDFEKDGEVINSINIAETNIFQYQADGNDDTVANLEESVVVPLYAAAYQFEADKFDTSTEEQETKFFAKTLHIQDDLVQHSSSSIIPQIPLIYPTDYRQVGADQSDYDYGPRILYFAGRRNGLDGYVNLDNSNTAYDFPSSFMVNYNDDSGYDPSLSFGDETLNNGIVVPGLLKIFHIQQLKRLEQAKQVREYINWRTLDIMQLSFRNKILLDTSKYILKKIDGYAPHLQRSTKTLLLKDAIPNVKDAFKVSNSSLSGVITN